MGLKKWIDRQLHPEQIAENPVLAEKLKTLDTLEMSSEELVRSYPTPQLVKQMVAGQIPFPSDPERRRMIQKLVARAEKKDGGPAESERAGIGWIEPASDAATAAHVAHGRAAAAYGGPAGAPGRETRRNYRGAAGRVAAVAVRGGAARAAAQARAQPGPAADCGARPCGGQTAPRDLQRAAVGRSPGGLLVQSFQRVSR